MIKNLTNQLKNAEGKSEFVIAVMCDIRGFSQFSTIHESPDIAMFIKRFYLKLLEVYFKDASFAKPTGDGLLLIFKYTEKNLSAVSEQVLSTCFQVLTDFAEMFRDDPIINFLTPSNLGFGISRGTACCLFSHNKIIDYSGQILNLSARLNDLARPKGIVIGAAFIEDIIPAQFRSKFSKQRAYIRSIAEESPRAIFCSESVHLPSYALFPLISHRWLLQKKAIKVSDLLKMEFRYVFDLDKDILDHEKTKLQFYYPNTKLSGYLLWHDYMSFEFLKDAKGYHIIITLDKAKSIIAENNITPDAEVGFEFQYVPKPSKRKSKKRA